MHKMLFKPVEHYIQKLGQGARLKENWYSLKSTVSYILISTNILQKKNLLIHFSVYFSAYLARTDLHGEGAAPSPSPV